LQQDRGESVFGVGHNVVGGRECPWHLEVVEMRHSFGQVRESRALELDEEVSGSTWYQWPPDNGVGHVCLGPGPDA
jgi:hypothetical protein